MILKRDCRFGSGLTALALLLLTGTACAPVAQPADARPAELAGPQLPLWEVRLDGAPLYLMGADAPVEPVWNEIRRWLREA